jgi:hypothetical protein
MKRDSMLPFLGRKYVAPLPLDVQDLVDDRPGFRHMEYEKG